MKTESRSVRNLRIASDLYELAYQLKFHQLRLKNPTASQQDIHRLVLELFEKAAS